MRVLIVTDSYPPLIGGATRASRQLARELATRGYEVAVATAWQPGIPARSDDDGIPVHRVRDLTTRASFLSSDPHRHTPPPWPDPEATLRLRRIVRRWRPDVVHAYGWLTYSAAAALLGRDIPLVVSARDYGNVCAKRTLFRDGRACEGPSPAKCLRCAIAFYGAPKGITAVAGVLGGRRLLRRKMRALHSVSGYVEGVMRRSLLERPVDGGIQLPMAVLPDFRDGEPESESDGAVLEQLPREPFILFVGALRRIKGIDELLEAYRRLDAPPPLVLIGTPAPDTPPIPDGVTVLESVPHEDVLAIWDRALFGVAPSVLPEPLGNVVHEAMSRGRPVIGTTPGGHAEMIADGESGILVPGGDVDALATAMRSLIDDPAARRSMGEAAAKSASRFVAAAVMPGFERLYDEVMSR
jgi:glycosyltransferase involved in cell wall biosynthesis